MKTNSVGIIGAGAIGQAFAHQLVNAGMNVILSNSRGPDSLAEVIEALGDKARAGTVQQGRILIDATNPVLLPGYTLADLGGKNSSQRVSEWAAGARVVKAFNTNFANTLATGKVGFHEQTVVLMASDFLNAKDKVAEALTGCRLKLMDAGKLRRAREMEAMGFLQISLASAGKLLWTRGFAIID